MCIHSFMYLIYVMFCILAIYHKRYVLYVMCYITYIMLTFILFYTYILHRSRVYPDRPQGGRGVRPLQRAHTKGLVRRGMCVYSVCVCVWCIQCKVYPYVYEGRWVCVLHMLNFYFIESVYMCICIYRSMSMTAYIQHKIHPIHHLVVRILRKVRCPISRRRLLKAHWRPSTARLWTRWGPLSGTRMSAYKTV